MGARNQKNRDVEGVLCEATGGYERTLVKALRAQQVPVLVEHANKIRAFAKSKGLLAKTDRIDAQLIKDYASTMKPDPKQNPLSKIAEKVSDLLKRRHQLLDDKIRETSRLDKDYNANIKGFISSHIDLLNQQIEAVQQEINQLTLNLRCKKR